MNSTKSINKLGLFSVISFVIANMVGTGVFTSLGFQLMGIHNSLAILILWAVGGLLAFCGALVYGELGSTMPRSGGEYHYLSKIYHPSVGFLSGWISLTVGFSAPVALACMAMAGYIHSVVPAFNPTVFALCVLTVITLVHSFSINTGSKFQNVFTIFKILLILVFVVAGFVLIDTPQPVNADFSSFKMGDLIDKNFAQSLIFVTYAFSGWNAAAYIAGDIKNPQRNLPKSLFISTIAVTAAYLLLNYVFLYSAPKADLAGQVEVGFISANVIFGETGGVVMALLISILLVSTISSMVFVGPRVSQVMGEDYKLLKPLAFKTKNQIPINAIWLQYAISAVLIVTSSFSQVMTYAGFTLNIFALLAVFGVIVHRIRFPKAVRPFKTWGYPVTPLLYAAIIVWTLFFLMQTNTKESLYGLLTVFVGLVIYFLNYLYQKNNHKQSK
jgi:basic amino acid/polyamine antiporter, APA family